MVGGTPEALWKFDLLSRLRILKPRITFSLELIQEDNMLLLLGHNSITSSTD
jgi:hypothetical protein